MDKTKYQWVDNSIKLAREIVKKHENGYDEELNPFHRFAVDYKTYSNDRKNDWQKGDSPSDKDCKFFPYIKESIKKDLWVLFIHAADENIQAIDTLSNDGDFIKSFANTIAYRYKKPNNIEYPLGIHKVTRYLYYIRPDLFIPISGRTPEEKNKNDTSWRAYYCELMGIDYTNAKEKYKDPEN